MLGLWAVATTQFREFDQNNRAQPSLIVAKLAFQQINVKEIGLRAQKPLAFEDHFTGS